MDSSVSPKEEIWFLHVCRHFSTGLYLCMNTHTMHTELELQFSMNCKQAHAPSIFMCSELKSISVSNLETLTVAQLVKRFICFYKIRKSITVFITASPTLYSPFYILVRFDFLTAVLMKTPGLQGVTQRRLK